MLFERDKWLQYDILRDDPSLAERLPETQLLEKDNLTKMLLRYRSVVLKPRNGSYGKDILFIRRKGATAYRIQNENNSITMRDTDQLLEWVEKTNKTQSDGRKHEKEPPFHVQRWFENYRSTVSIILMS